MPRTPRHDPDDGWHHVMNRGVDRMTIFVDDRDRRWFIRLLRDSAVATGVRVVAYCLVGNHFHLLVHCPQGGLSRFMGRLGAEYARVFNHRHHRDGPLFRARFTSKLVDSDDYLRHVVRYIHRNSLDIGVAPGEWRWSSYRSYAGLAPAPKWLAIRQVLDAVGGREQHRLDVRTIMPSDARLHPEADPSEVHASFRAAITRDVIDAVHTTLDRSAQQLDDQRQRAAALLLAADVCGLSITDLVVGLEASAVAVRSRLHRARKWAASDRDLSAAIEAASRELAARHAA